MTQAVMFRDKSIVALAGGTQAAIGLNGSRQLLQIENPGNANVSINYSGPAAGGTGPAAVGNDATPGTTGTITLPPNGSITLDRTVPQNPVNVNGTAGQPIIIIEG